jgi:hypothetical protein
MTRSPMTVAEHVIRQADFPDSPHNAILSRGSIALPPR